MASICCEDGTDRVSHTRSRDAGRSAAASAHEEPTNVASAHAEETVHATTAEIVINDALRPAMPPPTSACHQPTHRPAEDSVADAETKVQQPTHQPYPALDIAPSATAADGLATPIAHTLPLKIPQRMRVHSRAPTAIKSDERKRRWGGVAAAVRFSSAIRLSALTRISRVSRPAAPPAPARDVEEA